MVWRLVLLAIIALLVPGAPPAGGHPSVLPGAAFQDQDGRRLDLAALRGHVVLIVYGSRSGDEQHVSWGKRLDGEVRRQPPRNPPQQILSHAQMDGITDAFRAQLRTAIRPHVESGYSLLLDWIDHMFTLFGTHDAASNVVVADSQGVVHLVVSGPPEGEGYRAVVELLQRLR
jgi:hypothetical protein